MHGRLQNTHRRLSDFTQPCVVPPQISITSSTSQNMNTVDCKTPTGDRLISINHVGGRCAHRSIWMIVDTLHARRQNLHAFRKGLYSIYTASRSKPTSLRIVYTSPAFTAQLQPRQGRKLPISHATGRHEPSTGRANQGRTHSIPHYRLHGWPSLEIGFML